MSKYRLKRKTNQTFVITIVVISLLISVSIGYSLWSDTIFIHVNSNLRYVEPKLENIGFIKDQDGDYVSHSEDYSVADWLTSRSLDFQGDSLTETVDENTNRLDLDVKYKLVNNYPVGKRQIYISFNFTNNNSLPLTLGSYTLIEKSLGYDLTFTMPETIAAGDSGHFEVTFSIPGSKDYKEGKFVYQIKYQIGEVTRYMYFTATFAK